mgnify:CR=1 FL=1
MQNELEKETAKQFDEVVKKCRDLFIKKAKDYGNSWRVLRSTSVTDQLFIKAQRIRTIDNLGTKKIDESIESEFIGIINYCIIGMIQLRLAGDQNLELQIENVTDYFDKNIDETKSLMLAKNHDYGEAWRDMRLSSITDMILMKLMRIKQIEDNEGKTLVSEGIDANFKDIVNYSIFALIKLNY